MYYELSQKFLTRSELEFSNLLLKGSKHDCKLAMRALQREMGNHGLSSSFRFRNLDDLFEALHQVMPFLQRHELDGVARRDRQGKVHPLVVYYQEHPLHELLRVSDLDPEYRWFPGCWEREEPVGKSYKHFADGKKMLRAFERETPGVLPFFFWPWSDELEVAQGEQT